tara:strand:- start:1462 stop:1653 length:192 start_codon:yes stop_codon:yes gene_type:complete
MKNLFLGLASFLVLTSILFCGKDEPSQPEYEGPYRGGPWIHQEEIEFPPQSIIWAKKEKKEIK